MIPISTLSRTTYHCYDRLNERERVGLREDWPAVGRGIFLRRDRPCSLRSREGCEATMVSARSRSWVLYVKSQREYLRRATTPVHFPGVVVNWAQAGSTGPVSRSCRNRSHASALDKPRTSSLSALAVSAATQSLPITSSQVPLDLDTSSVLGNLRPGVT